MFFACTTIIETVNSQHFHWPQQAAKTALFAKWLEAGKDWSLRLDRYLVYEHLIRIRLQIMHWSWCLDSPFLSQPQAHRGCRLNLPRLTQIAPWTRGKDESCSASAMVYGVFWSGVFFLCSQHYAGWSCMMGVLLYDGGLVVILRMAYSCPNHCTSWWRPWCSWSRDRQEETRGNGPRSPWRPRPRNFLCLALRHSFNPIFGIPPKSGKILIQHTSLILEGIICFWKRKTEIIVFLFQTFHPLVPR